MQCMIHQYAKTEKDIIRLEEMINLKTIMEERSPVLDSMKREGRKEGEKIGEERGRKEGEIIGRKEGEIIGRKEGEIIGRKEGEIIGEGYTTEDILNSK